MMIDRMRPEEFDAVFQIMEQSFPTDERRPKEEQRTLLNEPRYAVYVHRENARVSAFLGVWQFEDFVFVEHFAVHKDDRNRGLGKQMLTALRKTLRLPLCLEVEPPENALAERRIGFYQRCGLTLNPYPYMQPPISKGKNAIPLMVMSSDGVMSEEQFLKVKSVLYREVYKTNNGGIEA